MKEIKLLVVTPYFYPKIGGLENYAYNIAKGLKKQFGYEIVIVTSNHEEKKYKEEILEGMKIYRLPRQFKVSNTPISFKWKNQIKEIIEKEKPDVINAHSPVPFISDVTCRIAHKIKIPFLLTYHAVTLYKKWNSPYNLLIFLQKLFLENKTFNQSAKVLTVSDFVKLQFNKKIQKKTEIVYNAISKSEIENSKSKKEYDLIFLGNLHKAHNWKGLDKILIALSLVKNIFGQEVSMVVLGDGNYKDNYEKLSKEYNLKKVKFVGAKFGEEKNDFLRKSKILITYPTTSNDAFPTIFLEGWAKGLSIISSNIGAIPYIIKNNEDGLLVEANNPRKLADKINKLLQDKSLQNKLIKAGYKKVKENFTWDISGKKMDDVIEEVLR